MPQVASMDVKYRYGHRPGRRRRTRVMIMLAVSFLILAIVGGVIALDLYKHRPKPVAGTSQTIVQALDESSQNFSVDEPTFTMELPSDWTLASRQNDQYEHSVTWQATKKHEDNRTLKVYVDLMPVQKSINNLLPIAVEGNQLQPGDVSDNCATFTQGVKPVPGDTSTRPVDTPAKWGGVDFICDLPRTIDREVGSGSVGAINTTVVTGPSKGTHKYFFLYVDHNIQPNDAIFINAIRSFRAK